MKTKNNKDSLRVIEQVLVLHRKNCRGKEAKYLFGPKLTGSVKGCMMPVGGHVTDGDRAFGSNGGYYTAMCRESVEECGLRPINGTKVAYLEINIINKNLIRKVTVFECTDWIGHLKRNSTKEFEWLKFFDVSKIPWNRLPPGDECWMKSVILRHSRLEVRINCGTSRLDMLCRPCTSPLYPN